MSTQTPPTSTLTGLPCPHAADMRCIECMGEGEDQVRFLAPAGEEEAR